MYRRKKREKGRKNLYLKNFGAGAPWREKSQRGVGKSRGGDKKGSSSL